VAIGGVSGAVGQGLVYPLDTVRTRLAVCSQQEYTQAGRGILRTAARMWRAEGPASLYRGLVPSMCGILPYAGVDIVLFETLKQELLERHGGDLPDLAVLGAGMVSSVIAQFVSYPLALVRTRLQAQGSAGRPVKYRGMADVFSRTLKHEGVAGLYKGLLPNLVKLAPAAGISWYVFESTKRLLGVDPRS
jgi:solute carrier family 25 phosphate transporter 23/24/25/41